MALGSTQPQPAEIVGSNPAEGINVCLLLVLRIVRYRSLRQADH
jgi:hypothetical protein